MTRTNRNIRVAVTVFLVLLVTFVIYVIMNNNLPYSSGTETLTPDGTVSYIYDNSRLIPKYDYIHLIILAFIFAFSIGYLLVSAFSKYSLKEIFRIKKKKRAFILSTIMITVFYFTLSLMGAYIFVNYNQDSYTTSSSTEKATILLSEDKVILNENYNSTLSNSNVIRVNGNYKVEIVNTLITKNGIGEVNNENLNSAIVAKDGAQLSLDTIILNTNSDYSPGVYSEGEKNTINIRNSSMTTKQNGSVVLYTDGTIDSTNSSYTSYLSEIAKIYNNATIKLDTGNITQSSGDIDSAIIISSSADKKGKASLSITGIKSTISAKNYITVDNNDATINYGESDIVIQTENTNLFNIKNSNVTLNISDMNLKGNILVDSNSTLNINLTNETNFTGSIIVEDGGSINLFIDNSSKMALNDNLNVSSLINGDMTNNNITINGHIYQNYEIII